MSTSDYEATSYGLVISIKHNTSHAMIYLTPDGKDPKNTPKAVLSPGGTDRLAEKADSTAMFVRLNYRVAKTFRALSSTASSKGVSIFYPGRHPVGLPGCRRGGQAAQTSCHH